MYIQKKSTLLFVATAALLVTMVFTGNAAAAEGFKIAAATVEGGVGNQLKVAITAENATGTEGGQFTLTFDQSLVKPVAIEPGDLVLSADSNLHMANLDYAPGELIFMWVTAAADTKDSGVVCRVTFDLLKVGTTTIGFKDLIIVAENSEAAGYNAGRIKVGPVASGEGTVTAPGQDTEPAAGNPQRGEGEDVPVEEVISEGGTQSEDEIIEERTGINPILIVIPIIIIVGLGVIYRLVKKSGEKVQKK